MIVRLKTHALFLIALAALLVGAIASADVSSNPVEGYAAVPGGKLYYASYGKDSGVPIIMVNGGPGLDSGYLLPQMLELAKDHKITFYDQRGSGKSQGFNIDAQTITMPNYVADLEALRKQLGYDKFILIGHSWGGLLAFNYAFAHTEHVKAILVLDSAPASAAGFNTFLKEYETRVPKVAKQMLEIKNSTAFKNSDPQAMADFLRVVFTVYFLKPELAQQISLHFNPDSARNIFKIHELISQNYFANYDIRPQLKTLQIPVLVLHGVNDIVPVATAKEVHSLVPNSKLVLFKNCDHLPYIEKPKEFFAALNNYLKSLG